MGSTDAHDTRGRRAATAADGARAATASEALAATISVCLSNSDQFDSFEWPTIASEFYRLPNHRQPPMEHPRPKGATMSDPNVAATPDVNSTGLSYNAAAGIAYLTIIPAIVLLIVDPFKKNSYVRFHAWQSIFFFIAWAVIDILVGLVQHIVPSR